MQESIRLHYIFAVEMRNASIQVRVEPAEAADFKEAAKFEGLSLSAWTRQALRDRARDSLKKAGRKPSYNGKTGE
jgi:uncharacterized protein (DUF1778 family)